MISFSHRKVTPLYPRWSSAKQRAFIAPPAASSGLEVIWSVHISGTLRELTHGISFTLTSTAFFRLWDSGMLLLLLFSFRFALLGLFVWGWESLSIYPRSPQIPKFPRVLVGVTITSQCCFSLWCFLSLKSPVIWRSVRFYPILTFPTDIRSHPVLHSLRKRQRKHLELTPCNERL